MAYTFPDFWTLWPRQILCMNKYIPLRAHCAYPLWKANLIVDGMIETIWWLSWLVIRWDKLESVFDYQTCLAPHTTTSNQPTLPPQPAAKLNKLEWEQFISNLEQNLNNSAATTLWAQPVKLKYSCWSWKLELCVQEHDDCQNAAWNCQKLYNQ